VASNGAFVNNMEIVPHFGYNRSLELNNPHRRRQRGLKPVERLPKLEHQSQYGNNFLDKDADFIHFDTVASTRADHTAISKGYLQKS